MTGSHSKTMSAHPLIKGVDSSSSHAIDFTALVIRIHSQAGVIQLHTSFSMLEVINLVPVHAAPQPQAEGFPEQSPIAQNTNVHTLGC